MLTVRLVTGKGILPRLCNFSLGVMQFNLIDLLKEWVSKFRGAHVFTCLWERSCKGTHFQGMLSNTYTFACSSRASEGLFLHRLPRSSPDPWHAEWEVTVVQGLSTDIRSACQSLCFLFYNWKHRFLQYLSQELCKSIGMFPFLAYSVTCVSY